MRASIVVASHNEGELLSLTVRSCLDVLGDLDCEILVSDDASSDDSVKDLQSSCRDPRVRLIHSPKRQGVSRTKDRGGRAAKGNVLIFLDGHMKPEPGSIHRLVEAVETWGHEAILAPIVASLDVQLWRNKPNRHGYSYKLDPVSFVANWVDRQELKPIIGPDARRYLEVPSIMGCNVALSKSLYEELGGFDTGMLYYGYEDLEFSIRSWMKGVNLLVDTSIRIGHRFRTPDSGYPYPVPRDHLVKNWIRMAWRLFGDDTFKAWRKVAEAGTDKATWRAAVTLLRAERHILEAERKAFHSDRVRDELDYGTEFGVTWPSASSPKGLVRVAEPRTGRLNRRIQTRVHRILVSPGSSSQLLAEADDESGPIPQDPPPRPTGPGPISQEPPPEEDEFGPFILEGPAPESGGIGPISQEPPPEEDEFGPFISEGPAPESGGIGPISQEPPPDDLFN